MTENAQATAFGTACSIRKWAVERGLLPSLPGAIEASMTANVEPIRASAEVESLLRQKMLLSIVYNETTKCIYLYTKRKVYSKDLKILPSNLNSCGIAYPQGSVDEIGKTHNQAQGAAFNVVIAGGFRRYTCGSSVSPGNSASAGTMGALVADDTGQIYGLTNNHVTGLCNHSLIGVPILAPGVLDVAPGVQHPFTIGLHRTVLEMSVGTQGNIEVARNSDAAIFSIIAPDTVTSLQGGLYDTPEVAVDPVEGMIVEKVGRTTGYTRGKIVGRELGPINVHYSSIEYGFTGNILFDNTWVVHGEGEAFSQGGDSGSLIVQIDGDGNRAAVGLLFAGGSDSFAPGLARTFFLPIRPILEKLQVRLLGGHNADLDG